MAAKWKDYCEYEPITPRIDTMRVLVIDNLLGTVNDLSSSAKEEPDYDAEGWVAEERMIAGMAIDNIVSNIRKLVLKPEWKVVHLSEINRDIVNEFRPDAIVTSGTLRDFDLYHPRLLDNFATYIQGETTPLLAICGGHQLLGWSFGSNILTLDNLDPRARRKDRQREYQYHYVTAMRPEDPIFNDILPKESSRRKTDREPAVRVWQNHGLMLDKVPSGFSLIGKGSLCRIQMMVKRGDGQLLYGVQFHLEKSFEDWRKIQSGWEHHNEGRAGRRMFENFLVEALNERGRGDLVLRN